MSGEQPSVEMVDCSDRVKLLYRAAKLIKSEITDCRGIAIRSPSVVDSSQTNAKSLIPDSLYWFLRWIIATPKKKTTMTFHHHDRWLSNRGSSDEMRILTLAQDVVHCATEATANMPKHVALGIAVRHTKRSKQLITMFSRMGPCSSYDEIEAMDTSTANEIIANSEIIGVILPSNISTCVFEQVAADNNDNMKTLLTVRGQPTPQHWSFF